MRPRSALVFTGILLTLVSQLAVTAPAPLPSKTTSREADLYLAKAYPEMVEKIKRFPHRFVARWPGSPLPNYAFAAKEVQFANEGKVILKGVWAAGFQRDGWVHMRSHWLGQRIELDFDHSVKRTSECEKARLREARFVEASHHYIGSKVQP